MKVTIEISDAYVPLLSHWASVSRTLTTAGNLLEEYLKTLDLDSRKYEAVSDCMAELDSLALPLDSLHQLVRTEIWQRTSQSGE